jgi:hypothetical protein
MIPGAIGIVANITTAWIVTITTRKSPVLLGVCMFPLAAAAAMYALPRGAEHRQQLLAVYFILQVYQSITPVIFSWCFANTAGHTKKTVTTAFLYVGLTVGNIVGPQLYKSSEAPYYKTGLTGNLVVLCILVGTVVLQVIWLQILNRKHNNARQAMGKSGPNVDYSLVSSSKWADMRAKQAAEREASGTEEVYNENAFKDMTDLKNEDFVYSL